MNYRDEEDEKKDFGTPHPDATENVNFFFKQLGRIVWLPNDLECPVTYELQDHEFRSEVNPATGAYENTTRVKEYKCVTFLFPKNGERMTTTISFHQPSRKTKNVLGFKEQLCDALNYFGSQGWIEHKFRNDDGSPKNSNCANPRNVSNDKWNQLFGK